MRWTEIKEGAERTFTLYHGTCGDALCRTGWKPNSGSQGGNMGQARFLYLSSMPEDARWFAEQKGCSTVLIVRDVPASYLIVDPEDGMADTVDAELNNTLGLPGKVALTRALGPEHFSIFEDANLREGVETIHLGNRSLNILKNPIAEVLRNYPSDMMRFLIHGKDFFLWDAHKATHREAGDALGIDTRDMKPLDSNTVTGIIKRSAYGRYDVSHINASGNADLTMTWEQAEMLEFHPVWQRYSSLGIRPEYDNMGW